MFEAMLIGTVTSYYESKIVSFPYFDQDCKLISGPSSPFHHSRSLYRSNAFHVPDKGKLPSLHWYVEKDADWQFDFAFLGPFLFAALMGLLTASLVQIFLPFNANIDLFIACFSVLIFSGFVLYDTQQIMKRLSVDEAILVSTCYLLRLIADKTQGSLTLYLDFLNLFLSVLRVVSPLMSASGG
jgi:hypothetical protein